MSDPCPVCHGAGTLPRPADAYGVGNFGEPCATCKATGRVRLHCEDIDGPCIMPGWACCACYTYNGKQRRACRSCGHARCYPRAEKVTT